MKILEAIVREVATLALLSFGCILIVIGMQEPGPSAFFVGIAMLRVAIYVARWPLGNP